MKAAAAVMVGLALVLAAVCWVRGGTALLGDGLKAGGKSLVQLLPLLVVVFLLTGFVEVLLPQDLVAKWLSGASGARGLGIAWVAGALTPGGGPVGLPLAAALMRRGAGLGVLVTYLTSMSLLSFVRVPLEISIYGPKLTGIRVACSALLPLIAGLLAQLVAR